MGHYSDVAIQLAEDGRRITGSLFAHSPEAQKAAEQAAARQRARERYADNGPHLSQ